MNYLENETGKQVGAKNVKSRCGKSSQSPRLPGATAVKHMNPIQLNYDLLQKRIENYHFQRSPTYPVLAVIVIISVSASSHTSIKIKKKVWALLAMICCNIGHCSLLLCIPSVLHSELFSDLIFLYFD